MATVLSVHADEGGTYVVNIATTDEDGSTKAPETLNWTLTDASGTTINSRDEVAIASPTASEDVVLSGDDCAIQAGETQFEVVRRIFIVKGTYNSTFGNGLPLRGRCYIVLENYEAVS